MHENLKKYAGISPLSVLIELCFYFIACLDLDEFMFWGKKIRLGSQRQTFLFFFHLNFFFEDGVLSCNSGDLLEISSFSNGVVYELKKCLQNT